MTKTFTKEELSKIVSEQMRNRKPGYASDDDWLRDYGLLYCFVCDLFDEEKGAE